MTYANVKKVAENVADTLQTNGIRSLSHDWDGGLSERSYVTACIVNAAYDGMSAAGKCPVERYAFHALVDSTFQDGLNARGEAVA